MLASGPTPPAPPMPPAAGVSPWPHLARCFSPAGQTQRGLCAGPEGNCGEPSRVYCGRRPGTAWARRVDAQVWGSGLCERGFWAGFFPALLVWGPLALSSTPCPTLLPQVP